MSRGCRHDLCIVVLCRELHVDDETHERAEGPKASLIALLARPMAREKQIRVYRAPRRVVVTNSSAPA